MYNIICSHNFFESKFLSWIQLVVLEHLFVFTSIHSTWDQYRWGWELCFIPLDCFPMFPHILIFKSNNIVLTGLHYNINSWKTVVSASLHSSVPNNPTFQRYNLTQFKYIRAHGITTVVCILQSCYVFMDILVTESVYRWFFCDQVTISAKSAQYSLL